MSLLSASLTETDEIIQFQSNNSKEAMIQIAVICTYNRTKMICRALENLVSRGLYGQDPKEHRQRAGGKGLHIQYAGRPVKLETQRLRRREEQDSNPYKFSIIIPTRNRCNILHQTIASVRSQSFPANAYEIIVVDNASTDGTHTLVERLNKDGGLSIHYMYEHRLGLHWARHAGAHAAKGEILAYIDDDAIAEPNWLEEIYRAYTELNADAAGGKILIQWDFQPPEWILEYEGILGWIDYGPEMRILKPGEYINGSNFSIRRDKLFQIGGFNPDQVEDLLIGDGETGLCKKMHTAGWRIAWVPTSVVWHSQSVARHATLRNLKRRFANNGVVAAYDRYRRYTPRTPWLLKWTAGALLRYFIYKFLYKLQAARRKVIGSRESDYWCELSAAHCRAEALYYLQLARDINFRKIVAHQDWLNSPPSDKENFWCETHDRL